jgi:hypothetical protein
LQTLDLAESVDASYVFGSAISADGSLIFQPGDGLIDVFDGRTGSFRSRVSVPFTLSPNYRALISNQQDSRLVAITGTTGNGIAVIDLNSLPEPQPLTYAFSKGKRLMREPAPASLHQLSIADKPELRASRVAPRIRHLPSALQLHNLSPHGKPQSR